MRAPDMNNFIRSKNIRFLVYCLVLIFINIVIWKTVNLKRNPNKILPDYTKNFKKRLESANLNYGQADGRFGLIVFLGDELFEDIENIFEELQSFNDLSVDVIIIAKNEKILKYENLFKKYFKSGKMIYDSSQVKYRAFSIDRQICSLILYQKEISPKFFDSFSASNSHELINVLSNICENLFLYYGSMDKKKSAIVKNRFDLFPYDNLINQAKLIKLNIDNLPKKKLILRKIIGEKENIYKNEIILSRPMSMTVNSTGEVFICDEREHTIFVLNELGEKISQIGRKGLGPGEFISPYAIEYNNGILFVVDKSLRLQRFNEVFHFIDNYQIGPIVNPMTGFSCLDAMLIIPVSPAPPKRKKLINIYSLSNRKLVLRDSFFDYYKPQKQYSSQMGAILSFNRIHLGSDSRRFLAFCRSHENRFYLLDLKTVKAYLFELNGQKINKLFKEKRPQDAPDFAARKIIKDIFFDQENNIYLLTSEGIIKIDKFNFANSIFIEFDNPISLQLNSNMFDHLAVYKKYYYFLSIGMASLAIFNCN